MAKTEKSYGGWYFLGIVLVLTIIITIFQQEYLLKIWAYFSNLIIKVIPTLILVFVIMFFINLFVTKEWILKNFQNKRGWLFSIIAGILSVGPIYLWYPLLSDLQDKGVRTAYLAVFLYNRAVKPALLPLIIFYFGLLFTVILTIIMIFASIVQGIIVEKIVEMKKITKEVN